MLRKRYQLLGKIEDVEGTPVALAAADAVLALNCAVNRRRNMVERASAQASLDSEKATPGRGVTDFNFGLDLRGSGALGTRPVWGKFARACGMLECSITTLTIGSVTSGPYKHGEHVVGGTSGALGIVIEDTAATPLKVGVVHGTFGGAETVTGQTSGASATTSGASASQGWLYITHSDVASLLAVNGSWTGTASLGEVLEGGTSGAVGVLRGGVLTGAVGSPGNLFVEMIPGSPTFAGAETLTGQTSGATITAHVSTGETMAWTPSLTLEERIDGSYRRGAGCRGNMTVTLPAGDPARLDFNFMGTLDAEGDVALATGTSYPTTAVLRYAAASVLQDGVFAFPTSAASISLGNAVGMLPDPTASNGDRSAWIGDRAPTVGIDPIRTQKGAYDWYGKLDAATLVSYRAQMGTAGGQRITVFVPAMQFMDISDGEREGLLVAGLTARARRYLEKGNDSIAIWMD